MRSAWKLFRKTIFFAVLFFSVYCSTPQEKELKPVSTLDKTIGSVDGEEIIPLKYRTIYIHHFDNRSFSGDMVSRLKERLQQSYSRDARLKMVTEKDKADLFMYGEIGNFVEAPTAHDQFGEPLTYLLTIIVSVKIRVNPVKFPDATGRDSVLLENRIVRFDTTYAPRLPPFETRFIAQERMLTGLCDRIVYTSFEGWYSELKESRELGYDKEKSIKEELLKRVIQKDLPKEERDLLLKQQKQAEKDKSNQK